MHNDQIIIGVLVALLCLTGLWKSRWFLDNTKKGRALVRLFDAQRAEWILQLLFVLGVIVGLLLAANVIHPIRW